MGRDKSMDPEAAFDDLPDLPGYFYPASETKGFFDHPHLNPSISFCCILYVYIVGRWHPKCGYSMGSMEDPMHREI